MGIISSRLYYPREDDEGVGQVDPTTTNNNNNDRGEGGGGGRDEEMAFPMTSLQSSLLPQLYNTPVIYSKIAIRKDTIKFVRVDKPMNPLSTSIANNEEDDGKVVIITKLNTSNVNNNSTNNEEDDHSHLTTSTTSTTQNSNNNNNNSNNDIELHASSMEPTTSTTTTTTTTTTTAKVISNGKSAANSSTLEPIVIKEGIYNIKFQFDSEEDCIIEIYLLATENDESDNVNCHTRLGPFRFGKGLAQSFSLSNSEYIDVSKFSTKDLTTFAFEKVQYPMIIVLKTVSYSDENNSSSSSTSSISPSSSSSSSSNQLQKTIKCQYSYLTLLACDDYTYDIKALKQKNFIDSKTSYITHDIYGYSNNTETPGNDDDKLCLTCMTDERDTLLIPCRHFYLCANCAKEIRGRCPLCRSLVASILKISKKELELQQLQHNNQQFQQQQQQL